MGWSDLDGTALGHSDLCPPSQVPHMRAPLSFADYVRRSSMLRHFMTIRLTARRQ